jgi:hypothetical protein
MRNEYRALEFWAKKLPAVGSTKSVVRDNWLRLVHGPNYECTEQDRHNDYPRWMRERDQQEVK